MRKIVKKTGEIYTPTNIVSKILDLANFNNNKILKKHIIDNSCGDGAFLEEIVRRYVNFAREAEYNNTQIKNDLQKYIHGIEINEVSHKKTIVRLDELIANLGFKFKVKWDILNDDALKVTKFNEKMDYVVGNPPYIRIHSLEFDYKNFEFAKSGMIDLYLIFFEIGLKMLCKDGKLAYITPNSYLTSAAGKTLREHLVKNNLIEKVLNLAHDNPFEEITTYPIIIVLNKEKKDNKVEVYNKRYKFDFSMKNNDFYINSCYFFIKSRELAFLKEILKYKNENCDVFVRNGLATNADWFFYNENFKGELIIKAIKASRGLETNLFFPYKKNGELIGIKEIKRINPIIYQKLLENKEQLSDRSLENKEYWYAFARTQAIKDVYKDKLTINSIIRSSETTKINKALAGTAVYSGLYIYSDKLKLEEIEEKIRKPEFIHYLKLLGKDKSGNYYYVSSKDLQTFLNYAFRNKDLNEEIGGSLTKNERLQEKSSDIN